MVGEPAAPRGRPEATAGSHSNAAEGGSGEPTTERGVVLRGTGGVWVVRTESGVMREASLRGRLKRVGGSAEKLAVGDDVVVAADQRGDHWAIEDVLPRRSVLARRSPGGQGERVVVANIDDVVVVFAAARPEPHVRMIDRFLVIAEANDLAARIVINKIDLVPKAAVRERFVEYERVGYPVHYTSVRDDSGLIELHGALAGRTSVVAGPSGVGKSSLLNALYPGLNLRVGEISEAVQKGRHTTVGVWMHPLPDGGYVVDTPGLREVGIWGLAAESVALCFPEIRRVGERCRFADCTHRVEPGCAVRAAVAVGEVSAARYDSYLRLREELVTGQ